MQENKVVQFLPRNAMHSAAYAVGTCLSVRPSARRSVTRRYSIEAAKRIIKLLFTAR